MAHFAQIVDGTVTQVVRTDDGMSNEDAALDEETCLWIVPEDSV